MQIISDKGFIYRIYRDLIKRNNSRKKQPDFKNEQRTGIDISPKIYAKYL